MGSVFSKRAARSEMKNSMRVVYAEINEEIAEASQKCGFIRKGKDPGSIQY